MSSHPADVFARHLRSERERLGVTQTDLARHIARILDQNLDPSAINRIEQGTRAVRLDEAVAAAEALDVSLLVLAYPQPTDGIDDRIAQAFDQLAEAQRDFVDSRDRVTQLTSLLRNLEKERRSLT